MLIGPQFSAPPGAHGGLTERLAHVQQAIADAAHRHGRNPADILLVAVSKQHGLDEIRAIATAGVRDFGENYAQEALAKIAALRDLELVWHFIGRLQANKTRAVAEHFHWVHTVDRERVAVRLSEQRPHYAPPLNICLQVQIGGEEHKGGIAPAELEPLARIVMGLPKLRLRGLMCLPAPSETYAEQLAQFRQVADYAAGLRAAGVPVDTLSMGMTADFEAAVAAGSTLVRVGTAIFGPRTL